jgi:hypothetical protein
LSQKSGRSKLANRVTALAALKSGLILAMYFLPDQLTAKESSLILLEVFDGLFPTGSISEQKHTKRKGSREKGSTKTGLKRKV